MGILKKFCNTEIADAIAYFEGSITGMKEMTEDDFQRNHPFRVAIEALREKQERKNPQPLTLDEMKRFQERWPIWIEVLDRPDLSGWHFTVRVPQMGLIAKDGLGKWEYYPHTRNEILFAGCYYSLEHPNNYGKTWLAYGDRPKED